MKTKNSPKFPRKPILIGIVAFLLIASGAFALSQFVNKMSLGTSLTTKNPETINYNPPTQEEKKQVDSHKDSLVKNQSSEQSQQAEIKQVTPVITDASYYTDQVEVRSFIPGVYEEGGNCKITFTKDSQVITKQVIALKDATTTRCTNLVVSRSEFSSGNWSVMVAYTSASAQGSSTPKTFEVK